MSFKKILEDDTNAGRLFDIFIQCFILISLISLPFETLPNVSKTTSNILTTLEITIVIIFSMEYILRICLSDSKLKFIFSVHGMVDLFAILPFYLSLGLDGRFIRVFRLFRLFRTFKLLRYSKAINRLHRALLIAKEELILFSLMALTIIYLASVGIYYFENPVQPHIFSSIFQSMWWAVVTLTTVGYGDIYPITTGGKIFTFLVLIIGLGIVAIPTGIVASALSTAREKKNRKNKK